MIAAFDELVIRCPDENSRIHIGEAVRCYENGAYKSAIVAAYMSVCFDLIEKLKVLSAAGDGGATDHLTHLTSLQEQRDNGNPQAISGLLEFERGLLEVFRDKFEFFGVNEFEELARLREDRNRCAHPTFFKSSVPYSPSAELARLHVRNALVYVLNQEPRQGRAALKELESVVLSKYFPAEVKEATIRLKAAGLSNARDALTRGFVDALLFGFADSSSLYRKHGGPVRTALEAIIEINRPVALPRAIATMNKLLRRPEEDVIRFASIIAIRVKEIGLGVDNVAKGVLTRWLKEEHGDYLARALTFALEIDWLKDAALARISELKPENFSNVYPKSPRPIVDRAAELYSLVASWDEADRVGTACAMPLVGAFSEENFRLIFSRTGAHKNDLISSGSFKRFVWKARKESPLGRSSIDALLLDYELSVREEEQEGEALG